MNFIVYLLVLIAWAPSFGFSQVFAYVLPPLMGPIQIESTDSGFPPGVAAEVQLQVPATTTVVKEGTRGLFDGIMNSFFGS
ncbi:uncharacterized protein CELE_C16C4.17 [Caenorhabditis elegans]|uniref:Secreted protein n=2 Tax=Caenorhabditis elegans TaxID=6239 RepID=F3NWW2_CAEEL|nr:Secreted protein [Caenorhabditis elegans]CCD64666.1 Secreted protein [Caenorhabditis elegans]|eukprot:NP_001254041.1 Uncharacterized protein CELE_C16C4.17 [Caenorhabditis elegans]